MRVFLIINVVRRRTGPPPEMVEAMTKVLRDRGVDFRIEFSYSLDDSRDLLDRAVREGYDSLWIGGGDGTVNHVLNATLGKFDSYGIVPLGTVNGLARALGVPRDPVEAVGWLLDGEPTGLELGRVGDRYFVLYATIGFHAAIFHNTNKQLKRLVGKAAFFAAGAWEVCRSGDLAHFKAELHTVGSVDEMLAEPGCPLTPASAAPGSGGGGCDSVEGGAAPDPALFRSGEDGPDQDAVLSAESSPTHCPTRVIRKSGYSLVISNFLNFSGFGAVREGEIGDSSFFLTHLFPACGLWPMLRFYASVRFRRPRADDPGVEHHRVSEVTVRSKRHMWLQVDGEPVHIGDNREFHFVCIPNAVKVLWNKRSSDSETD